MKNAVIQTMVTWGDKDMMTQAFKQLEFKSIAQLVTDMLRRECGYVVEDYYGDTRDEESNTIDFSRPMPEIEVSESDAENSDSSTWMTIRINRDELFRIQQYSRSKGYRSVPYMVLSLLRKRGWITRKTISSISETTEASKNENTSMRKESSI
jgi:hypothetical protein